MECTVQQELNDGVHSTARIAGCSEQYSMQCSLESISQGIVQHRMYSTASSAALHVLYSKYCNMECTVQQVVQRGLYSCGM